MEENNKQEYDNEPVWFCRDCLSLKIIKIDDKQCFCDICGNMNISETDIKTWQKLYENKYKHKFLEYGRKRSNYVWKSERDD